MDSSLDSVNGQRSDRSIFTATTPYNTEDGFLSSWYAPEWQLDGSASPHRYVTLHSDPVTVMSMTIQGVEAPMGMEEGFL